MDDARLMELIEALVAEEHRLLDRGGSHEGMSPEEHRRMATVTSALDQAWDLLRQRRARQEFGLDPDEASPRDGATLRDYEQ